MYARLLSTPTRSVFLFGPRGTGKTTWIRDRFPNAATYDLLDSGEALRLSKRPDTLYRELAALPAESWVVIDEVQKVPGWMAVRPDRFALIRCLATSTSSCAPSGR